MSIHPWDQTPPAGNLVLPAADYKRNRTAWITARKDGLGASDTAAVLGLDPWRTPLDVYLDKISPTDTGEAGEAAEWGSAIEAVVARKVGTRHRDLGKIIPSPGIVAHPEHPWLRATPDRLLYPRGAGQVTVLEIKTTDGRNKPQWADGPPVRVQIQVQQQLAVLGLDTAYVAVLFSGREMPDPYRIDRDQAAIDALTERARAFWFDHVIARNPPDAMLGDDANLSRMFPGDDVLDALIADDALELLFTQRARAAAAAKETADRLAQIDLAIKTDMGDRLTIVNGDGHTLATWKPQTVTRLDSKRLKADHPDLAADYSTTTTTRVFRAKGNPDD